MNIIVMLESYNVNNFHFMQLFYHRFSSIVAIEMMLTLGVDRVFKIELHASNCSVVFHLREEIRFI